MKAKQVKGTRMLHIYDVIIIGAGPAGLMAGSIFKSKGLQYLILEKGSMLVERCIKNPEDVITGVGGGGLFSDGKLSLPPSASALWTELPSQEMEKTYNLLARKLQKIGIDIPKWKKEWRNLLTFKEERKRYESILLNEFSRFKLANYLCDENINNIRPYTEVTEIVTVKDYYEIKTKDNSYFARKVLISAGRFGNDLLSPFKNKMSDNILERYEIGIRIEVPDVNFKPQHEKCADYKIIRSIEDGVELRTFCSCKDGVVLQSKFNKYITFNGSQMPFQTYKSNIGIVVRTTKEGSLYEKELKKWLKTNIEPFKYTLKEFIREKHEVYGKEVDLLLKNSINEVVDLKEIPDDSYVYGPEIEYAGEYINLLHTKLKLTKGVWVAGDLTGSFRGLVAALISGLYCANCICTAIAENIDKSIKKLGIKVSNFEKMGVIFTAQSKNFFYCKDVICEFVLKRGKLPINPFMVFGYFLNDRVSRNLIRQGNNQLIQSSDELWVFGPIADGVLFEIALAKKTGKPIKFFKLGTRSNEIKEITVEEVSFEPEVHAKQIKKSDLTAFLKNQNIDDGQLDIYNFLTEEDDEL